MSRSRLTTSLGVVSGAALVATLAACGGSASAAGTGFAKDENTLVMGQVPDQASTEVVYQPLVDYIELESGKTVELVESANYAALVEAAIAGQLDIGSFSGFTYVAAVNGGADLIPIGAVIREPGAEPGYESLAFVPADSDIQAIEDFRGKQVCFVDPGSTSGYLFPSSNLLQADIDPEADITPVFAGGHDASVQKTAQGVECEAGFAEDAMVEHQAIADGLIAEGDLRVIQRTIVPGPPIVLSGSLPQDVRDELTEILQNLSVEDIEAAGIEVNDAFREYFYATVPIDDAYYQSIRDVCEYTGASQCNPE